MANEVKKLHEMGIVTPQTKFYLAKLNEKAPIKVFTVEQEPRKKLEMVGTLRVNEFGDIVHPPVKPEEPDTSNWKRMTAKRQMILSQYRKDLADYEEAMAKWLELTPINDAEPHPPIIVESTGIAVLTYFARGFGEVNVCSRPVTHTELEILEVREEIQTGFNGNASQPRRRYKRNRDLDMNTEYDTDLETGEKRQQTLFNCRTADEGTRIVDSEFIERFEAKPNAFLGRMYLDYILNGTPIDDWYRFQINKWIKKIRVSGQTTL